MSAASVADAAALRPMRPADAAGAADVFYEAQDELHQRLCQPLLPRNEPALVSFLQGLVDGDRGAGWIAEVDGARAVAFGVALRRESFWFLSFLFVRPEAQAVGLGRRILERCLPRADASDAPTMLATCVEAIQPVSAGLYARYGIVPRVPIYALTGEPRRDSLPALPRSVRPEPFELVVDEDADGHRRLVDATEAVDRATLGYARPGDHRAWRLEDRRGVLYRAPDSGRVLGYGYVQASGRLGPIAAVDAELLPAILGDLFGRARPPGPWVVFVPGSAAAALVALLQAGLRFDGAPALFSASHGGMPLFDRYLPAGFALL